MFFISCVTQHCQVFQPFIHNTPTAEAFPPQTWVCDPFFLGAQLGSFLLIQLSAVSDAYLIAWRRAWPHIPSSFSCLLIYVATKPWQSTSTGRILALQPCCSASVAISTYRSLCTAACPNIIWTSKTPQGCYLPALLGVGSSIIHHVSHPHLLPRSQSTGLLWCCSKMYLRSLFMHMLV